MKIAYEKYEITKNMEEVIKYTVTTENIVVEILNYGCIVGRIAGRIKNGLLKIQDKEYQLSKNNGNNNLHGGPNGLHRKV